MHKILILEDNQKLSGYYVDLLTKSRFDVAATKSSDEFFKKYYDFKPHLLILDIMLNNSKLNGLEVYRNLIKNNHLTAKVIILSGEASRMQVAEAMKLGAYTFIDKSSDFSSMKFLNDIKQAIKLKEQEDRANSLDKVKEKLRMELMSNAPLVGKSPQMMYVKERISRFASNEIDVLIEGETGTGKDIVAKQLYLQSNRVGSPYVIVNSGGIPESLIDSELFGHKKGSFTGAYSDKKGFFEQANKGILFLDEISNLNLNVQAKILRAIEQKEVRIVGGENKIVDVRLIFASNKKLKELAVEGKFRDDLFYRLDGHIITLPPLRERGNDIILLFEFFCDHFSQIHHCHLELDLDEIKRSLLNYYWPGNVRELKKFCEYLFVIYDKIDTKIVLEELSNKISGNVLRSKQKMYKYLSINDHKDAMDSFEKKYLEHQMKLHDNKVSIMAETLGLDRTTLYKKLKKLGIK